MPLKSFLFEGNQRLERCLVNDSAHVVPGDVGPHVRDIQIALTYLDNASIRADEKEGLRYGSSTADAVLAYKRKRQIINRSYQNTPDNIVGKMTIARLDQEMLDGQSTPRKFVKGICISSSHDQKPISVVDPPRTARVDPKLIAELSRQTAADQDAGPGRDA